MDVIFPLFSCQLVSNLFPFPLSSAQRVGICYNNNGCAAFPFMFLMQRQYNSETIHACAKKGSAACGKKSTKILKIYILALRVPSASLQARHGDIAHLETVHTWGQCTRRDSAQLGTLHTWNSAHVGTVRTYVGTKKGNATMENISLFVIDFAYSLGCNKRKRK